MIANGAVTKLVLAVALGGSAGAISYVSLQHASVAQVPITTTVPAGVSAVSAPDVAGAAKADLPAHSHLAKTALTNSACAREAKAHSKMTSACREAIAAVSRTQKSKILGYTKAMAVQPLPVQPVVTQHVDRPLSPANPEIFKPVTDVLP